MEFEWYAARYGSFQLQFLHPLRVELPHLLLSRFRMLKITALPSKSNDDGYERVLKLEGKLVGVWVAELREVVRRARAESGRVQLDLSELSFADISGIIALRELIRQGVGIITISPFIGELLKERTEL